MYVVVDIETTGLSPAYSRVTEIACARVADGQIVREFQSLVNPEQNIPRFITKLTGIDNAMVRDAPKIYDVLPAVLKFMGERTVVAHNASFDMRFLQHNAAMHLHKPITNDAICTRLLANRLFPELPSKRLGSICSHLNIVNEQAHRALGDVRATTKVFGKCCEILEEKGLKSREDILKFQRR